MVDTEVIVAGAGLAGLRCAVALQERGHEVLVLEAADEVGGRIRTDVVDGFRADRGFQLLNPAYPAVRRWIDVDALDLRPFVAGVTARTERGLETLGHPVRAPRLLPATVAAAARRPREVTALARWVRPLLSPHRSRSLAQVLEGRGDADLRTALDRARVTGVLRTVVERFFAGVVLEDDLATSERFALLLAAMFVSGVPSVPRAGMAALPQQVAAPLGDRVRLRTSVERVRPDGSGKSVGVTVAGEVFTAHAVVVATGGREAGVLLDLDPPAAHGVVTTWWALEQPPASTSILHVDARARPAGPVVNTAVVSHAVPEYAPPGAHLVQASALMGPMRPAPSEDEMRRHAGEIYGVDTGSWRVLLRHEVPHALPAQPAPLQLRRPVALGDGLFVCGDHRDTASIQGALVSGQRAADAVADLLR